MVMDKLKIKRDIWIKSDMFYSEAFKGLTRSAMLTLMRCMQKRKWEKQKIHGKKQTIYFDDGFIFPYSEMEGLFEIGETTCWKNVKKLVEVGFLDIEHQGGWYQKHEREKDFSVYKYSERWRNYGTLEFVKAEKKKVLPESSYIRANIARQKLKSPSQKRSCHLHKSEVDRLKTGYDRLHESEVDKTNRIIPESFVNRA